MAAMIDAGYDWCEDSSNSSTKYRRNKVMTSSTYLYSSWSFFEFEEVDDVGLTYNCYYIVVMIIEPKTNASMCHLQDPS